VTVKNTALKRYGSSFLMVLLLAGLALADPTGTTTGSAKDVPAEIPGLPSINEIGQSMGQSRVALNILWTMMAGFMVMFMQAGFSLVEMGFVRSKNAANTALSVLLTYGIGVVGFWGIGFALQMGGAQGLYPQIGGAQNLNQLIGPLLDGKKWGLIGGTGFGLAGNAYDISTFTLFFFQSVFLAAALAIPTGAFAERIKTSALVIYAIFASVLIYPIFANWVWGGGWLSSLGINAGLGHGYVDFAGSGVVHLTGGVMALMGVLVLGPRIGKYGRDGSVRSFSAHNLPLGILGTFILAFGWFGFNAGSTLAATDVRFSVVAVSAMLSSTAGMLTALAITWASTGKVDVGTICNGMLAGLAANTACGAFIGAPASIVIGALAAMAYIYGSSFIENRLKIDDPVGAIAVHGIGGIVGVLSVGIFADGTYGAGINGVAGGVTGILYGGYNQFLAQIIGIAANLFWVGITSYALFRVIDATIGMRVKPEAELHGLDNSELLAAAYETEPEADAAPMALPWTQGSN
jgi:ammonium transporter, Amt family